MNCSIILAEGKNTYDYGLQIVPQKRWLPNFCNFNRLWVILLALRHCRKVLSLLVCDGTRSGHWKSGWWRCLLNVGQTNYFKWAFSQCKSCTVVCTYSRCSSASFQKCHMKKWLQSDRHLGFLFSSLRWLGCSSRVQVLQYMLSTDVCAPPT